MGTDAHRLTIIGDIGVDLVLGPLSGWPRVGTETILERSELRAGGSAGNAALAVSYLGGASRLLSAVGNDDLGSWLTRAIAWTGRIARGVRGGDDADRGTDPLLRRAHLLHDARPPGKLSYELLRPRLTRRHIPTRSRCCPACF